MSTDYSNFLAMPEKDHHLRRSVFLLVVLAFIIILAWAYARFYSIPPVTPPPPEQVQPSIDQRVTLSPDEASEKQKMLDEADTSRVKLTKEEIKAKELELEKINQ